MRRSARSGLWLAAIILSWGCTGGGVVDPTPVAEPYRTVEVAFPSDGLTLRGTLYLPQAATPVAAVVIVPGSGPINRDGIVLSGPGQLPPIYRVWADLLSREGIAVLRYDKRFLTYPNLDLLSLSQEDQIRDVLAAVRSVRSRPEVDPDRVFVLGHSEGASLAPVAAARDLRIKGVVGVAALAFAVDTLVLEQLRASPEFGPEEITEVARKFRMLREGGLPEGETILGAGAAYWREWIHFSQRADSITLSLQRPVRIIQGLADEALPGATLSKNVRLWENAAARSSRVEFGTYEGVTHNLLKGVTQKTAAEVVQEVAQWIRAR
jgi:dienelactone hydrolase